MDLIGELTFGNEAAGGNRSESAVDSRNFGFNSAARRSAVQENSNAERRLVEPPCPPVFERLRSGQPAIMADASRPPRTSVIAQMIAKIARFQHAMCQPADSARSISPSACARANPGLAGSGQELGVVA